MVKGFINEKHLLKMLFILTILLFYIYSSINIKIVNFIYFLGLRILL